MPRIQAWERLNDHNYSGSLSMSALYDLVIAAGYSERTAQKIANQRGRERMDAGIPQ